MRDKPLRIIPTTPSRYAPPFGAPRGLALNGRVKLRVVPSCGYGVVVRPSGFFNHVRHLPDARPLRPRRTGTTVAAGRHTPPSGLRTDSTHRNYAASRTRGPARPHPTCLSETSRPGARRGDDAGRRAGPDCGVKRNYVNLNDRTGYRGDKWPA